MLKARYHCQSATISRNNSFQNLSQANAQPEDKKSLFHNVLHAKNKSLNKSPLFPKRATASSAHHTSERFYRTLKNAKQEGYLVEKINYAQKFKDLVAESAIPGALFQQNRSPKLNKCFQSVTRRLTQPKHASSVGTRQQAAAKIEKGPQQLGAKVEAKKPAAENNANQRNSNLTQSQFSHSFAKSLAKNSFSRTLTEVQTPIKVKNVELEASSEYCSQSSALPLQKAAYGEGQSRLEASERLEQSQ